MQITLGGQVIDFLTVSELKETVEPIHRTLQQIRRREKPTDNDLQASATASAAGVALLDFGAPDASQVWDVRRITITGQDTTVIVACTVRLFKREVGPLTLVDIGTQVPTVAVYSRHECTYKPGENLLVRVTGFTVSAYIGGLVQVEQTTWQAREQYSL